MNFCPLKINVNVARFARNVECDFFQTPCTHIFRGGFGGLPHLFQSDILCAGFVVTGQSAGQGDSGGPLVTFVGDPKDPYYLQVAVVSGSDPGPGSAPDVFTRLDDKLVLDWIKMVKLDEFNVIVSFQIDIRRNFFMCALNDILESNFTTVTADSVCQCRYSLRPSYSSRNCSDSVRDEFLRLFDSYNVRDSMVRDVRFIYAREPMENCLKLLKFYSAVTCEEIKNKKVG